MQRTQLKLLRIKHGFSQEKMAVRLGYSRNHYAGIENGKHETTLKFIEALCSAFGLSLAEAVEVTKRDNEQKESDR